MARFPRRRGRADFYAAPLAASAQGIVTKRKIGASWWAQAWIAALENLLGGDAGRLARGRTYARGGRVSHVEIQGDTVTARVTGSRIYKVTIQLRALPAAAWHAAIVAMAGQASFAAALLNGTMPQNVDEVFRNTGSTLFPTTRAELQTTCTCPDWGDPCKHVAAVHYLIGDSLDNDPFLLFELRGQNKQQLMAALRAARLTNVVAAAPIALKRPAKAGAAAAKTKRSVKAPAASAPVAYDQLPTTVPTLQFSYSAPAAHVAAIHQLGTPAGWTAEESPGELLGPLVAAASEFARRVANADPESAANMAENPAPLVRNIRDKRAER